MSFIKAYIKSMRPYTFFITGFAGLLGMLLVNSYVSLTQKIIVFTLLFLSYGVNQVINDLLGLKEDKINAPKRPLVTGELNRAKAIYLTTIIFIFGAILSYYFNPYALVIYVIGYSANFVYEYLKGIPLLGNFWFGFMISLATLYGALAITDLTILNIINNQNLIYTSFLILLSSSTFCYFTYFKDYIGDKKTNKRTIVVLMKPKKARKLNFIFSLFPFLILFLIFYFNLWDLKLNNYFLFLISISFILFQYTSFLYYKNPSGKKKQLELSFESVVLFEVSLLSLVNPLFAMILFILSFAIIKISFRIMYKENFY